MDAKPSQARSSVEEQLSSIVLRSLERELAVRGSLEPHAQLGVAIRASRPAIDDAYRSLAKRYDPIELAAYGADAAALATKIGALLADAHARLTKQGADRSADEAVNADPRRRDDTQRALETLKDSIARRIAEAEELARTGHLVRAIGALETVLLVDRRNEGVRSRLSELRARLEQLAQRPPFFHRMWARLFRSR